MEGREFVTLDKELLLQTLQNMSLREVLRWCKTNQRFRDLCQFDPLFYDGILREKTREEGLAEISVDHITDGVYSIMASMVQDNVTFYLEMPKYEILELLEFIKLGEEGMESQSFTTIDGIRLDFEESTYDQYGVFSYDQYMVDIHTKDRRGMIYFMIASDFKNILLITLEIAEKGFDFFSAEVEGHILLLLDGTTEFIAH